MMLQQSVAFPFLMVIFAVQNCISENVRTLFLPCHFYESVNISDAVKESNGKIVNGIHRFSEESGYINFILHQNSNTIVKEHLKCICGLATSKSVATFCCPENFIKKNETAMCERLKHETNVNSTNHYAYKQLNFTNHDRSIRVQQCDNILILYDPTNKWELQEYSTTYIMKTGTEPQVLQKSSHCIHRVYNPIDAPISSNLSQDIPKAEKQVSDDPASIQNAVYPYFMAISIFFLIFSLGIYAILPELRNLHGKCMMCYMLALILMYSSLSLIKKYTNTLDEYGVCGMTGYIAYASMMVTFFFLNVITIDIYSTFNMSGKTSLRQRFKHKLFYVYAGYAIGVPMLLVATVFFIDRSSIPQIYKPGIGYLKCSISEPWLFFVYQYFIISIILIVNTILFSITAYRINSMKKNTVQNTENSRRHSQTNLEREKFFLFLRLFIVTGIFWILEVLSYVFESKSESKIFQWIFLPFDLINISQGEIIFLLFICKRSVWKLLNEKWYNRSHQRPFSSENAKISLNNTRKFSRSNSNTVSSVYNVEQTVTRNI